MDVHIVPGVKAKDVAEAHRKDLLHQGEHHCKCMTYWIDEERENIFCLIEAPNKEAVEILHRNVHGLVPNKVIEVNSGLVESFLGRIYDPEDAKVNAEGLKVFAESSFRYLLLVKMPDPILLREDESNLLEEQVSRIRKAVADKQGRETEDAGKDFVFSFQTVNNALQAALYILQHSVIENEEWAIAIHAGEPVENSERLFGDTIQLANRLLSVAKQGQVIISFSVKELLSKDPLYQKNKKIQSISLADEELLSSVFKALENHYQEPEFNIEDYSQALAMSKSQLYRNTIELFDLSPNALLKEFRLEKAKELLKKQRYNISEITFDTGFTSPSYFTKCFKKKYGLLPVTYLELSH
jgi:AraC-like DNA-binding protein